MSVSFLTVTATTTLFFMAAVAFFSFWVAG
jgi:hypothetical protein